MPPSPQSPPRRSPPPPAYKHFCRVCNKGFTCGSALGGHMRAHGVGYDGLGADDDDSLGNEPTVPADGGAWDTAGTSKAGTATTHVYALRENPNRLIRSCQVCKNCGKEFSSMELFLEHGKCKSGEWEDADGSPHSSPPSVAEGDDDASLAAGWSKGKLSRRAKLITTGGDDLPAAAPSRCPSGEEEEDLANCLVMLSSSKVEQASGAEADKESCASASKEYGKRPQLVQPFSFALPAPDPAMVLPLALPAPQYVSPVPRGMFECKACKKVFTSHQALGGHRASHKKVKGCFAANPESSVNESPQHAVAADPNEDKGNAAAVVEVNANGSADARTNFDACTVAGDTNAGTSEAAASLSMAITTTVDHEPPPVAALAVAPYKKKPKMHECSVCHRLFSSGQALGGHKRCHWLTSSTADHANLTPFAAEGLVSAAGHQLTLRPMPDAPEPALDLTIAANPLPVMARARVAEVGNSSLHLDASAAPLYFQPSVVPSNATHQNKTAATTSSHHNVSDAAGAGAATAEDEADSTTVKRARLSDLKGVSTAGETTPWLQVGIGSSSAGGDGKSTR